MRREGRGWLLLMLGIALSQGGCSLIPLRYSAEPIEGRVIDAQTKEPLEGVIVVAQWVLETGSWHGRWICGPLMVMESVTDRNGSYRFPRWGPVTVEKCALSDESAPELLVYKPGYQNTYVRNQGRDNRQKNHLKSDWNGLAISLHKSPPSLRDQALRLEVLARRLEPLREGGKCEWKKMPHMLVALYRFGELIERERVTTETGTSLAPSFKSALHVGNEKACGSATEFFRDYLK